MNGCTAAATSSAEQQPLECAAEIRQAENTFQLDNINKANTSAFHSFGSEPVRNPDGTPLLDHNGNIIPVDKFLGTKPLKRDLSTRPGPGNRQLTYMSGECVTRTLNEVFGFDGWCLEIKGQNREECVKDDKGRWHIAYTTTVRLTHRRSGAFKEDCGSGDAIDKSIGTAVSHALKGAVTDAMKRAARHFGEKLGNTLYQGNFNARKAPSTLASALDQYEIEQKQAKFGDKKVVGNTPMQSNPAQNGNVPVPSMSTSGPKHMNHGTNQRQDQSGMNASLASFHPQSNANGSGNASLTAGGKQSTISSMAPGNMTSQTQMGALSMQPQAAQKHHANHSVAEAAGGSAAIITPAPKKLSSTNYHNPLARPQTPAPGPSNAVDTNKNAVNQGLVQSCISNQHQQGPQQQQQQQQQQPQQQQQQCGDKMPGISSMQKVTPRAGNTTDLSCFAAAASGNFTSNRCSTNKASMDPPLPTSISGNGIPLNEISNNKRPLADAQVGVQGVKKQAPASRNPYQRASVG